MTDPRVEEISARRTAGNLMRLVDLDYLLTKLDEAEKELTTRTEQRNDLFDLAEGHLTRAEAAEERERALIAGVREANARYERSAYEEPSFSVATDMFIALAPLSHLLPSTPTEELGTVYVVCDRLLDPETNEHCEFDGDVVLDAKRRYRCPGCRRMNYAPDEGN